MTVITDTAESMAGAATLKVSATDLAAIAPAFAAAGKLSVAVIDQMADSVLFAGKGVLDSFRVTHLYEYDPGRPLDGSMATRKARLSFEGILGND